ncbi:MAG: hypothetical protein JWL59_4006 [Chthoniobacteraceae bacterium]|nr:hypothetical protein [Chthoniobacteraceae bacterium]
MDIYILRDGKEIGPFSQVTTQTLLDQGTVFSTDLAWRPGMPNWIPLDNVLDLPAAEEIPQIAPRVEAPATVLATERQKAFLRFMEIPFTEELTKERAAVMMNDVMEDPKDAARVAQWNKERLILHPELFDAEIQAQKENRPNHFLQIAQNEGAEFFTKITKAHCMVVVGHLDLRFPDWDAKPKEATWNYFFPAIAEKFPQLVNKSAAGRFKYPEQEKTVAKPAVKTSVQVPRRPAPVAARPANPMAAALRGIFIGALILGALFGVNEYRKRQAASHHDATAKEPVGIPEPPPNLSAEPAPKPRAPKPVSAPPVANVPAPAPSETDAMAAQTDPAMAAPAPVELAPAPAEPLPVAPKTIVTITQPVKVTTPFGVVVIRPGTQAKIISREGGNVSVRYLNNTVSVPVTSTDLGDAAVAAPAEAVPPAAVPAPAAPVAPVKPPTSLF